MVPVAEYKIYKISLLKTNRYCHAMSFAVYLVIKILPEINKMNRKNYYMKRCELSGQEMKKRRQFTQEKIIRTQRTSYTKKNQLNINEITNY